MLQREERTDLIYAGALYYSPWLGRWLSVDPFYSQYLSLTSYQYSSNNPLRFFDPNGKYIIDAGARMAYRNTSFEVAFFNIMSFTPMDFAFIGIRYLGGDPDINAGKVAMSFINSILYTYNKFSGMNYKSLAHITSIGWKEGLALAGWESSKILNAISAGINLSGLGDDALTARRDRMLFLMAEVLGLGYEDIVGHGTFTFYSHKNIDEMRREFQGISLFLMAIAVEGGKSKFLARFKEEDWNRYMGAYEKLKKKGIGKDWWWTYDASNQTP